MVLFNLNLKLAFNSKSFKKKSIKMVWFMVWVVPSCVTNINLMFAESNQLQIGE